MISIVGIGPTKDDMTIRALATIKKAEVVIGYKHYIQLIEDLLEGKEIIKKGMGQELLRAEIAIQKSQQGKKVAIISSGDPGIFGMANVFFHLIGKYSDIQVEVVPGVSAVNHASSLLGAPLHDFAVISLSDILTPLEEIKNKIKYAIKGNLIIALYNPRSKKRTEPFYQAQKIFSKYLNPNTPVGIVQSTTSGPETKIIPLKNLKEDMVNMSTILIVGNTTTYVEEGYMITPRGYALPKSIHPLSQEFFENFLTGERILGPNKDCEYYPCHAHPQNCTFCYCPFYPCGDRSTGGKWIKDKGVWSCQDCDWIHQDENVNCIMKKLPNILESVQDLKNKKRELLKLRRECLLKINKQSNE